MIDFEFEPQVVARLKMYRAVAEHMMRPISREYDEREHEKPWQFYQTMWASSQADLQLRVERRETAGPASGASSGAPRTHNLDLVLAAEELCWGDAGLFISIPNAGLGGAAVTASGTPEQKERFLKRFREGGPKWSAMAISEPGCGSESAALATTATRDGDHWVINGAKMFCTSGYMAAEKSEGFVVVWATIDKSAGRGGIKPFVVEHHTPGMTVIRVENKLGIRASDTAAIVFDNCRIPLDHLLGSPEVRRQSGLRDVAPTLDTTRTIIAAMSIGVGRAALDCLRDFLGGQKVPIRYGLAPHRLTAIERDFMEMEANLKAVRLLAWRSAWMLDQGRPNRLEASMAKAKAGQVVTQVTQKAVEILGPLGYSRRMLVEKWMRDAKINDIYEGTQQMQMLIVARSILNYGPAELN
jgi:acyl-CoA dehydrogenase